MADDPNVAGPNPDGSTGASISDRFIEFGHVLRGHGLPVGTDDVLTFCAAVAQLRPGDLEDVYWSGRSTLVHRRDHLPVYDEAFRQFFLHHRPPPTNEEPEERMVAQGSTGSLDVPDAEPGDEESDDRPLVLGLQASGVDLQRNKRFADCTPEELQALRRIITRIRLEPPLRTTRRRAPDPSGAMLDIRRMAREAMRWGDPAPTLLRMGRKRRPRPLVLILDVSGSMADYSRQLLQFAYSMRRAAQKVEVFCFGTRLTRITPLLDRRSPDEAMRLAAERVLDWDGGTRIGPSLDTFIRRWGRNGLSRGALVVICSDGLDRGGPRELAEAMERLERLSYRIIWMNPLQGGDDTVPDTLGMAVAAPFVDAVTSGRDLAGLEQFAVTLPRWG